MKRIGLRYKSTLFFICLTLVGVIPFVGCSPSKSGPIEGAWQMTSQMSVAADGTRTINKTQEYIFLFSGGHYSMALARGDEPSPAYTERFIPTEKEKADRMSAPGVAFNKAHLALSQARADYFGKNLERLGKKRIDLDSKDGEVEYGKIEVLESIEVPKQNVRHQYAISVLI